MKKQSIVNRLSAIFAILLISPVGYAQSATAPDAIVAQEGAFWKAYAEADTVALSKMFLPDFINVEEQLTTGSQVLAFVRAFHEHGCTLAAVRILSPHVAFLTPDIATLAYHAIETPKCGKQTSSGDTNITTVWVRRDGRWQMHLHTEYAIPRKLSVQER